MRKGKKRILMAAAAAVLVPVLAGAVWAASTQTPPKLTEAQQKELIGLQKQILEIRKQIIRKQVEFKLLTPVEGKAMEANLEVMAERMENWDGTGPGMGFGPRGGRGRGGFGGGRMAWKCPYYRAVSNGQPE